MEGNTSYQSSGGQNTDLQKYSHSIGSNIQKISQNVKSMQQLVNQLGTDQDNQQLRTQLHQVQRYTNGLAKDTTVELRTFKSLPVPPSQDSRTWHMQTERLTREFSQALNEFQKAQRQAASKEKEALKRARADSDAQFFDEGRQSSALVDLGEVDQHKGRSQQAQVQLQMEQEQEMAALQERESQIRQLESDIMDVNQIFKDLATMVHEQGEIVDSIEANVEAAQVHVSQATTQISQASSYQDKSRRKVVLITLTCLLIALVIGLIIWASSN